jgi:dCTP deaminase
LFIHVTAGYGDVGFKGFWTLEIVAVEPVRIYSNMEIGQLSYYPVCGEITDTYHGKYQGSREIVSSKIWKELHRG